MSLTQGGFEVVRDPLWDNIRLDPTAVAVMDTPTVQRLRYIRQLGHAFLVYPGATHSRFEHALGTYHLARRALSTLADRVPATLTEGAQLAVQLAALLHDIGHYPYSHALEEAGFLDHETIGIQRLSEGELGGRLREIGGEQLIQSIGHLIAGTSTSPLGGLVSGSLDLDKIDYLSRDARMCGVRYGGVDVDRLIASLTLVGVAPDQLAIGVHEKGISALESLLFAKYQMYRNVYWHHAVRAATCMFKRVVRTGIDNGDLRLEQVAEATDGTLDTLLLERDRTGLARAIRERRLYKRALDLPASEATDPVASWVWEDAERLSEAEAELARRLKLPQGGVLIDFPVRPSMLSVDLPLETRDGSVEHLTDAGMTGQLGLPRIADELYRSARRLRIFTVESRRLERVPEEILSPKA